MNTKTVEIEVPAHVRHIQKTVATGQPAWVRLGDRIAVITVTLGAVGITAVVLWQITIDLALIGATGYALWQVAPRIAPTATPVVVEAPVKPKRHYQRRLTVHDYQTGKTIKL